MKYLLITFTFTFTFTFICSYSLYSMENSLAILNNEGLNVYDMQELTLIITLEEPQSWHIIKATQNAKETNVLLFKLSKNSKDVLEKSVVFDNNSHTILYIKDISHQDNTQRLDVSVEQYLSSNNDIEVFSSWHGNIYLLDKVKKNVIVRDLFLDKVKVNTPYINNYVERKKTCGYFSPELSSDREMIICYLEKSKHNRKKSIGKNQICEINVKSKEVKLLPIYGIEPSYSPDDRIILYQDIYDKDNRKIYPNHKWRLYYKERGYLKIIPEAYDVAWINVDKQPHDGR